MLRKLIIQSINQSINQSTLLVHPIKMGFHIPITIKSNMNNKNIKQTFESDKTLPYYLKNIKYA